METINTKIEIIRKEEPNGNFGVIMYDNWNRNSLKELNTRFELAEERISKLKDRSIESI